MTAEESTMRRLPNCVVNHLHDSVRPTLSIRGRLTLSHCGSDNTGNTRVDGTGSASLAGELCINKLASLKLHESIAPYVQNYRSNGYVHCGKGCLK